MTKKRDLHDENKVETNKEREGGGGRGRKRDDSMAYEKIEFTEVS